MKKSEKLLLLGLIGVPLIWKVAIPIFWGLMFSQIDDAKSKLDDAEQLLSGANAKFDLNVARLSLMKEYKDRALSANYSEGSHAYMQWLSDLTEDVVKLRKPRVDPERMRPSRDNTFVAIRVRITGEGTIEQLREFLFRFHRANVLHQITGMTAQALDNSSRPRLDISITAEALSIRDGELKGTTLFPRTEVVSVESDPDKRLIVKSDTNAVWPAEGPFEVRIGEDYLQVNERVKQLWTTDGTGSSAKAGATVSYTPPAPKPPPGEEPILPKPRTTKLAADWDGKASVIEVESDPGLPEGTVEVKIGDANVSITGRSEVWMIDDQKFTTKAGAIVELSPIHPDFADATIEDFDRMISLNPFAKPVPYRPRFDLIGDKNVARGKKAELTPKATGFGGDADEVKYEVLSELPPGMTFADGKLTWEPPADLEAGKFTFKMKATAPGLVDPLEGDFEVSLRDENLAPQIKPPADIVAVIGQPLKFTVTATDEDSDASELEFSLGEGAPAGATIDAKTGEVAWTPGEDTEPGSVSLPIQVSDKGTPKQTTTTPVTVTVEDDKARFTYLTGFVATNKDREAWLHDRSTNKRLVLKEGAQMKYAGYEGLILTIGADFVLLQNEDETLRINMGHTLREAVVVARATKPEYDETPEGEGNEKPAADEKPDSGDAAAENNDSTATSEEQPGTTKKPVATVPAPTEAASPDRPQDAAEGNAKEKPTEEKPTDETNSGDKPESPAKPESSESDDSEPPAEQD